MAASLVQNVDSDGDGPLTLEEMLKQLSSKDVDTEQATSAFSGLDKDGDGKLSASEISAALEAFRAAYAPEASQTTQAAVTA